MGAKRKFKDEDSDPEVVDNDEIELGDTTNQAVDKKDRPLSEWEREKADLESAEVIPDSEISPAAFIFTATEEEQQ